MLGIQKRKLLRPIMCAVLLMASSLVSAQQTREMQNAPGLDIIGRGYDVFGKYANQTSLKPYHLFDFNTPYEKTRIGSRDYSVPDLVILENISEHHIQEAEGYSLRTYAENIAKKAGLQGKYFFFSASINKSFSKAVSSSEELFYYTYMDVIPKWRITLDARDVERLKAALDPLFAKDLQSLDPRVLFQLYGTHFVASAYLGGRAEYSSKSEITEKNQTTKIKTALKANYNYMSIKGYAETTESQRKTLREANTKITLSVVGGNAEYANNIKKYKQYNRWVDGIKGTPVLCDFVNDRSLLPIWILCDNPVRKAELQKSYTQYCEVHPLPQIRTPPKVYRLSGRNSIPSGLKGDMVRRDFELIFDVKPMSDKSIDIVGAVASKYAIWKIYFPSNGNKIRFICRNGSLKKTIEITGTFSNVGKKGEWNHFILKRDNNIISLQINGILVGQRRLEWDMPVSPREVKFGYFGDYLTNIHVRNIQIK